MQSLLHPVAPIDWRQHFDIGAEAQAAAFELETLARLLVAAFAGAFAEPRQSLEPVHRLVVHRCGRRFALAMSPGQVAG